MQDKDRVYEENRLIRTLEEIGSQLQQMQTIEGAFTKIFEQRIRTCGKK